MEKRAQETVGVVHGGDGRAIRRLRRIFVGSILLSVLIVLIMIFGGRPTARIQIRATLPPMLLWSLVVTFYAYHAERERLRLEHKLRIASDIQLSLLPEHPLSYGALTVAGTCRPAEHVGGDLLDYWRRESRVCMMVADVTGHDLGAALLATAFRSVVRAESAECSAASELAARVNLAIHADLVRSEMLVTFCYMQADLDRRRMTYCSAGHPPPLLIRGDEPRWLEAGGLLLGVYPETYFEEQSLNLEPGDTVVLYTDGVLEARSDERGPFGADRLLEAARSGSAEDPRGLTEYIIEAVVKHLGGKAPEDDVTVLAARFEG